MANEGGGRDNITVVVVDVVDDDGRAAAIADAQAAAAEARAAAERAEADEAQRQAALAEQEQDLEPAAFAGRRSSLPESQDDYRAEKDDLYSDLDRVGAKRFTWRVAAFVLLLLVVAGAVIGALYFSGSATYHARIDGGVVRVFKGEDGGLFSGGEEFQYDMRLDVDEIPEPYRSQVAEGIEFPSLQNARQWEFNVADAIESQTTTTTTTEPTTTTEVSTTTQVTTTTSATTTTQGTTTNPPATQPSP